MGVQFPPPLLMYYVYFLRDNKDRIYIGYTSNLKERLREHLNNKVYTTSRMDNPHLIYYLIYYEAYLDKKSAQIRERKLKQFGSSYQGLLKRLKIK